ncbi:MAG: cache domain-containing protein [Methanomicrobiales archaeon]
MISPEGVVLTAVPANYAGIVGEDLGWQLQVQTAHTLQAPIVSDVFMMAEGFAGISQSYPIFSPSGEYLGYTDITYTPEAFIERQIRLMVIGTGYDVWVAQTDGTVIYDTTAEEIGRNLFTDPAYDDPALQEIFGRIVAEPAGAGLYTFWDENWDKTVTRAAVWRTAGIDGAEWRVVVTRTERVSVQTSPPLPAPSPGEATDGRYRELTQYVQEAAGYAREHGREAALAEFNDPDGAFTDHDRYIFAYDMDGTTLALPLQLELIGTNRLDFTDTYGVEILRWEIDTAERGGGSVYVQYLNPETGAAGMKLCYVAPVDDDWFVGSGIYTEALP